jgi:hypothetical protein
MKLSGHSVVQSERLLRVCCKRVKCDKSKLIQAKISLVCDNVSYSLTESGHFITFSAF